MSEQVVTVRSWEHAIEVLYDGAWNPRMRRFRSPFVFRGLSQAGYELLTTLQRLAVHNREWTPKLEQHLLRSFKKYAHRDVVARDTIWHWLAVAQHRGLATRLMDWTYSPLVALHFATANMEHYHIDGVVWMVHLVEGQRDLPAPMSEALKRVGGYSFDAEMLANTFAETFAETHKPPLPLSSTEWLDRFAAFPGQKSEDGFVLFFEPPSIDDRIVNQYGLFSILSNSIVTPGDWFARRPEAFRRVIIPADKKWEIRDKLDQANVEERVLFPGLDGLCSWLNRNYFHREPSSGQ